MTNHKTSSKQKPKKTGGEQKCAEDAKKMAALRAAIRSERVWKSESLTATRAFDARWLDSDDMDPEKIDRVDRLARITEDFRDFAKYGNRSC